MALFMRCTIINNSRMYWICVAARLVIAPILMLNLVSGVVLSNSMQAGADVQATPSGIYIPLSIYVSSLLAVAIATWTVARYDMSRIRRMEMLESTLLAIQAELRSSREPNSEVKS